MLFSTYCIWILFSKKLLRGYDPVLVHGDVSVDTWVLLVSAANAPRGGANHLAVVDNWSAGIALAGVLAADIKDARAEHAAEDRAVVVVSVVADRVSDDVDTHTFECVWVVSDNAGGGVAPAADENAGAVWHPFAVARWWERHSNDGTVIFGERAGPLEHGDVVLLVAVVVLSDKFANIKKNKCFFEK